MSSPGPSVRPDHDRHRHHQDRQRPTVQRSGIPSRAADTQTPRGGVVISGDIHATFVTDHQNGIY